MNPASCDLQILKTVFSHFLLGCMTRGKLLKLSWPQFLPLSPQPSSEGCLEDEASY